MADQGSNISGASSYDYSELRFFPFVKIREGSKPIFIYAYGTTKSINESYGSRKDVVQIGNPFGYESELEARLRYEGVQEGLGDQAVFLPATNPVPLEDILTLLEQKKRLLEEEARVALLSGEYVSQDQIANLDTAADRGMEADAKPKQFADLSASLAALKKLQDSSLEERTAAVNEAEKLAQENYGTAERLKLESALELSRTHDQATPRVLNDFQRRRQQGYQDRQSILLGGAAKEPDLFVQVPRRVSLTGRSTDPGATGITSSRLSAADTGAQSSPLLARTTQFTSSTGTGATGHLAQDPNRSSLLTTLTEEDQRRWVGELRNIVDKAPVWRSRTAGGQAFGKTAAGWSWDDSGARKQDHPVTGEPLPQVPQVIKEFSERFGIRADAVEVSVFGPGFAGESNPIQGLGRPGTTSFSVVLGDDVKLKTSAPLPEDRLRAWQDQSYQDILNRISVVNKRTAPNPEQGATRFYIGRASSEAESLRNISNRWTSRDTQLSWVTRVPTKEEAVQRFSEWFHGGGKELPPVEQTLQQMLSAAQTGKIELACWCAPNACHGHVIKEHIANTLAGVATPPADQQTVLMKSGDVRAMPKLTDASKAVFELSSDRISSGPEGLTGGKTTLILNVYQLEDGAPQRVPSSETTHQQLNRRNIRDIAEANQKAIERARGTAGSGLTRLSRTAGVQFLDPRQGSVLESLLYTTKRVSPRTSTSSLSQQLDRFEAATISAELYDAKSLLNSYRTEYNSIMSKFRDLFNRNNPLFDETSIYQRYSEDINRLSAESSGAYHLFYTEQARIKALETRVGTRINLGTLGFRGNLKTTTTETTTETSSVVSERDGVVGRRNEDTSLFDIEIVSAVPTLLDQLIESNIDEKEDAALGVVRAIRRMKKRSSAKKLERFQKAIQKRFDTKHDAWKTEVARLQYEAFVNNQTLAPEDLPLEPVKPEILTRTAPTAISRPLPGSVDRTRLEELKTNLDELNSKLSSARAARDSYAKEYEQQRNKLLNDLLREVSGASSRYTTREQQIISEAFWSDPSDPARLRVLGEEMTRLELKVKELTAKEQIETLAASKQRSATAQASALRNRGLSVDAVNDQLWSLTQQQLATDRAYETAVTRRDNILRSGRRTAEDAASLSLLEEKITALDSAKQLNEDRRKTLLAERKKAVDASYMSAPDRIKHVVRPPASGDSGTLRRLLRVTDDRNKRLLLDAFAPARDTNVASITNSVTEALVAITDKDKSVFIQIAEQKVLLEQLNEQKSGLTPNQRDRIEDLDNQISAAEASITGLEKSINIPTLDLIDEDYTLVNRKTDTLTRFASTRRGGVVLLRGSADDISSMLAAIYATTETKRELLSSNLTDLLSIEAVGSPVNPASFKELKPLLTLRERTSSEYLALSTQDRRGSRGTELKAKLDRLESEIKAVESKLTTEATKQQFALVLHPSFVKTSEVSQTSTVDVVKRTKGLTPGKTRIDISEALVSLNVPANIMRTRNTDIRYDLFKEWVDRTLALDSNQTLGEEIDALIEKVRESRTSRTSIELVGPSGQGGESLAYLVKRFLDDATLKNIENAQRFDYNLTTLLGSLVTPEPVSGRVVTDVKFMGNRRKQGTFRKTTAEEIVQTIQDIKNLDNEIRNATGERSRILKDQRTKKVATLPLVYSVALSLSEKSSGYNDTATSKSTQFKGILELFNAALHLGLSKDIKELLSPSVTFSGDIKESHSFSRKGYTKDVEVDKQTTYYHLATFGSRIAAKQFLEGEVAQNLESTGLLRFKIDRAPVGQYAEAEFRVYVGAGERVSSPQQIEELLGHKNITSLEGIQTQAPAGRGLIVAGTGHRHIPLYAQIGRVLKQFGEGDRAALYTAFRQHTFEQLVGVTQRQLEGLEQAKGPIERVIAGGASGFDSALAEAVVRINQSRERFNQENAGRSDFVPKRLIGLELHLVPSQQGYRSNRGEDWEDFEKANYDRIRDIATRNAWGAVVDVEQVARLHAIENKSAAEIALQTGMSLEAVERVVAGGDYLFQTNQDGISNLAALQAEGKNVGSRMLMLRNKTMVESADILLAAFDSDNPLDESVGRGTRHAVNWARSGHTRQGLEVVNILGAINNSAVALLDRLISMRPAEGAEAEALRAIRASLPGESYTEVNVLQPFIQSEQDKKAGRAPVSQISREERLERLQNSDLIKGHLLANVIGGPAVLGYDPARFSELQKQERVLRSVLRRLERSERATRLRARRAAVKTSEYADLRDRYSSSTEARNRLNRLKQAAPRVQAYVNQRSQSLALAGANFDNAADRTAAMFGVPKLHTINRRAATNLTRRSGLRRALGSDAAVAAARKDVDYFLQQAESRAVVEARARKSTRLNIRAGQHVTRRRANTNVQNNVAQQLVKVTNKINKLQNKGPTLSFADLQRTRTEFAYKLDSFIQNVAYQDSSYEYHEELVQLLDEYNSGHLLGAVNYVIAEQVRTFGLRDPGSTSYKRYGSKEDGSSIDDQMDNINRLIAEQDEKTALVVRDERQNALTPPGFARGGMRRNRYFSSQASAEAFADFLRETYGIEPNLYRNTKKIVEIGASPTSSHWVVSFPWSSSTSAPTFLVGQRVFLQPELPGLDADDDELARALEAFGKPMVGGVVLANQNTGGKFLVQWDDQPEPSYVFANKLITRTEYLDGGKFPVIVRSAAEAQTLANFYQRHERSSTPTRPLSSTRRISRTIRVSTSTSGASRMLPNYSRFSSLGRNLDVDSRLSASAASILRRSIVAVQSEFLQSKVNINQIKVLSGDQDNATSTYNHRTRTLYITSALAAELNKAGSLLNAEAVTADDVLLLTRSMLELRHELIHATKQKGVSNDPRVALGARVNPAIEALEEATTEILNRSGFADFMLDTFKGVQPMQRAMRKRLIKDLFKTIQDSGLTGETPDSLSGIVSARASKLVESFTKEVKKSMAQRDARYNPADLDPTFIKEFILNAAEKLAIRTNIADYGNTLASLLGISAQSIGFVTTSNMGAEAQTRTAPVQPNLEGQQDLLAEAELRHSYFTESTASMSLEGYSNWLSTFLPAHNSMFTDESKRAQAVQYLHELLISKPSFRLKSKHYDELEEGALPPTARQRLDRVYSDTVKENLADHRLFFQELRAQNEAGTRTGVVAESSRGFYNYLINSEAEDTSGSRSQLVVTYRDAKKLTAESLNALLTGLEEAGFKGRVRSLADESFAEKRMLFSADNLVVTGKTAEDIAIAKRVVSEKLREDDASLVTTTDITSPDSGTHYQKLAEQLYDTLRSRFDSPEDGRSAPPEGFHYGGSDDLEGGEFSFGSERTGTPELRLQNPGVSEPTREAVSFSSPRAALQFLKDITRDDPTARIELHNTALRGSDRIPSSPAKSWFTYNETADTLVVNTQVQTERGAETVRTTATEADFYRMLGSSRHQHRRNKAYVSFDSTGTENNFLSLQRSDGSTATIANKQELREHYGDPANRVRRPSEDEVSRALKFRGRESSLLVEQGFVGPSTKGEEFIIYEHKIPVLPELGGFEQAKIRAREVAAGGQDNQNNLRSYNTIQEGDEVGYVNGRRVNLGTNARSIMPNLKFSNQGEQSPSWYKYNQGDDYITVPVALGVNRLPQGFDASDYVKFRGVFEGTSLEETRISPAASDRINSDQAAQNASATSNTPLSDQEEEEESVSEPTARRQRGVGRHNRRQQRLARARAAANARRERRLERRRARQEASSVVPENVPSATAVPTTATTDTRTAATEATEATRRETLPGSSRVMPQGAVVEEFAPEPVRLEAPQQRETFRARMESYQSAVAGLFGSDSGPGRAFTEKAIELFGGLTIGKALASKDDKTTDTERFRDIVKDAITDTVLEHPAAIGIMSRTQRITDGDKAHNQLVMTAIGAAGSGILGTAVRAAIPSALPNLKSAAGVLAGVTAWAAAPVLANIITKFKEESQNAMAYDDSAEAQKAVMQADLVARLTEEGESGFVATVLDENGNELAVEDADGLELSEVAGVEDESGNPLPFDVTLSQNPFLPG